MNDVVVRSPIIRPPGIVYGMSEDDYFGGGELSVSALKKFDQSPAHYMYGEKKETAALALGKLIHTAILEPESLNQRYLPTLLERRGTKAWEAEEMASGGRELVKKEEWDSVIDLRRSVMDQNHELRNILLAEDTRVEASFFWQHDRTGMMCRGRADILNVSAGIAVDLKKSTDARERQLLTCLRDYKYHWQQAFYMAGLRRLGVPMERFIFTFMEDYAPYASINWELPEELIQRADMRIESIMDQYAECVLAKEWPGYPSGIQVPTVPKYLLNDTWPE